MKRARQAILVLCIVSFSCCRQSSPTTNLGVKPAVSQEMPTFVSVTDLSLQPLKFDGRLVAVRATLELGWEGDDFLIDPSVPPDLNLASRQPAKIWFYCKPDHEQQVYAAMTRPSDRRLVGLFTGYFHFVPDQKSRIKDVFDPGALQLEAIGVFEQQAQ